MLGLLTACRSLRLSWTSKGSRRVSAWPCRRTTRSLEPSVACRAVIIYCAHPPGRCDSNHRCDTKVDWRSWRRPCTTPPHGACKKTLKLRRHAPTTAAAGSKLVGPMRACDLARLLQTRWRGPVNRCVSSTTSPNRGGCRPRFSDSDLALPWEAPGNDGPRTAPAAAVDPRDLPVPGH